MKKSLDLMQAWEYNNRGLMYVPQSGDWADEYYLHGYVLYDQVLRLWALKCFQTFFPEKAIQEKIAQLEDLITHNFILDHGQTHELYHATAYQKILAQAGEKPYWLSSFYPGGYTVKFDVFANALCLLQGLGDQAFCHKLIQFSEALRQALTMQLLPAFYPPVFPDDDEWHDLSNNHKYAFRNHPYEFHNGGTWPVLNGFWGIALVHLGEDNIARQILNAIHAANAKHVENTLDWGFYENFHTQKNQALGTKYCAWSAAAAVLLHHYLEGKKLVCA